MDDTRLRNRLSDMGDMSAWLCNCALSFTQLALDGRFAAVAALPESVPNSR